VFNNVFSLGIYIYGSNIYEDLCLVMFSHWEYIDGSNIYEDLCLVMFSHLEYIYGSNMLLEFSYSYLYILII
jgi:hypothetical protein